MLDRKAISLMNAIIERQVQIEEHMGYNNSSMMLDQLAELKQYLLEEQDTTDYITGEVDNIRVTVENYLYELENIIDEMQYDVDGMVEELKDDLDDLQ